MEVREPSPKYLAARSRDSASALENWTVESLGDVSSIERGKFSARPRNDPRLYGGEFPFLQTGDVAHSRGRIRTFSQTLNASGLLVSRLFPEGTLFFTIAANIGDVGISSFAAACPDSLVAITPRNGVSAEWLLHELASRKGDFEKLASPGAQLNINLEKLRPYLLAVPPTTEQRGIAEALTDADALIDSLEQLLTKKRQIKQGAMQELFNPASLRARTMNLEQISGFITKGATPTTYGFGWESDGIVFLRSECVSTHGLDLTQSMFISEKAHAALRRSAVSVGDLLMTITGNVGRVAIATIDCNINQHIARIRISDPQVSPDFIYHQLSRLEVREELESITTGQAYPQLSLRQVRERTVQVPSRAEQDRIAETLTDIDYEIATLESRLTKARALKQAMAQALLTGRIRLVGEGAAA